VANSFRKALKHLKSTQINEQPTNSMSKVYAINPPGYDNRAPDRETTFVPDVDGNWPAGIPGTPGEVNYTRPEGVWQGGSNWDRFSNADLSQDSIGENGTSTEGLIEPDGTVKTLLPPDSRHFILGPLTDGFTLNHTSDAYTNIGYLQKDTRQFVLLGRVTGQMKADLHTDNTNVPIWDGTSNGFTAYNSNFTLEMAQWFRSEILASRYLSHVPYFYSGGVPQTPQSPADCPTCPDGMKGGNTVGGGGDGGSAKDGSGGGGWGSGGNPNIGTKQGPSNQGDAEDAGYDGSWNQAFWGGDKKDPIDKLRYDPNHPDGTNQPNPFEPGTPLYNNFEKQRAYDEHGLLGSSPSGGLPDGTQIATHDKPFSRYPAAGGSDKWPGLPGSSLDILHPSKDPLLNIPITPFGMRVKGKSKNQTTYVSHYEPQGKVLKESFTKRQIKLIKERKKEFKVPELPKKYKMNFAGKYSSQNTPDVTSSKRSDELVASGNAKGQRWRAEDKYWQGYETTERMNVIYDRVGHGEQAWERVIGEARRQNAWKNREIQEQLNIIEHEKAHRKIYENYESPWGTVIHEGNQDDPVNISTLKDPLLKKVQKRLKKEIEYDGRPATDGYPNDPPPEMVNGWHPKLGKKMPYKKLDPESAKMMPNTGDPDIDVNIKKARKKPK
tara:strand:- start:299 stop:2287 length:1989 start_codon:yes stop_codon:yes gene_type:complete